MLSIAAWRGLPTAVWRGTPLATEVKVIGSVPLSMTKEDIGLTTNPCAPTCRLLSSMVLRPPHRHICFPFGYSTQIIPQPAFIENGADPQCSDAVWPRVVRPSPRVGDRHTRGCVLWPLPGRLGAVPSRGSFLSGVGLSSAIVISCHRDARTSPQGCVACCAPDRCRLAKIPGEGRGNKIVWRAVLSYTRPHAHGQPPPGQGIGPVVHGCARGTLRGLSGRTTTHGRSERLALC